MAALAATVSPDDSVASNAPGSPANAPTSSSVRTSTRSSLATRSTIAPIASFAHSPDGTSLA
jgi:hypothetical protein